MLQSAVASYILRCEGVDQGGLIMLHNMATTGRQLAPATAAAAAAPAVGAVGGSATAGGNNSTASGSAMTAVMGSESFTVALHTFLAAVVFQLGTRSSSQVGRDILYHSLETPPN